MATRSITKPSLRKLFIATSVLLVGLALATLAHAQPAVWPTKPVRIVVTFPPGGAPDTLARILADKWGQSLGQSITVDNKPGAGGNIGADFVAKCPPDGTALVVGTVGTHAINAGELFNTMAGVKMQHIPYKGRAQAVPDLLGGRIAMIFDNMPSALPLVKAGEVKAIAVTSAARSPAAPNIPTIAESGLPGFEATSWFALYAPAGLPKDVQMRINAETARVMALPDVKEKLATLGLEVATGTPEALGTFMQAETAKWAKVVKESGAKPD